MVDDSFTPSLEDEAIEVQHLLAEPETDHVLVDGVSCFGNENSSKRSEKDAFSYGFDEGMRRNIGNFLTAYCFFLLMLLFVKDYFVPPTCGWLVVCARARAHLLVCST